MQATGKTEASCAHLTWEAGKGCADSELLAPLNYSVGHPNILLLPQETISSSSDFIQVTVLYQNNHRCL